MPNLALAGASAGGGRSLVPDAVSIAHAAGTGFTISNYDSAVSYTLSAGSRSGDAITLAMSTPATVTAQYPKGVASTATVNIERRTITYTYTRDVINFYTHNGPCHVGDTCYGTCGDGSNNCGHPEYGDWYYKEDSPPAGFTKLNGEWVKIA